MIAVSAPAGDVQIEIALGRGGNDDPPARPPVACRSRHRRRAGGEGTGADEASSLTADGET